MIKLWNVVHIPIWLAWLGSWSSSNSQCYLFWILIFTKKLIPKIHSAFNVKVLELYMWFTLETLLACKSYYCSYWLLSCRVQKEKGITWLLFLTYAILVREDLRLILKIFVLLNLQLQSSDKEDKISWNRLTTTSSDQSTVLQNRRTDYNPFFSHFILRKEGIFLDIPAAVEVAGLNLAVCLNWGQEHCKKNSWKSPADK